MGFTPIEAGRVAPHIERGYHAGAAYQWVRETAKNAFEASAKNVTYGVEWQGVAATGTYRLAIVDDGYGMLGQELRTYFRTFGGGGKPIGATDDNYGIGSKTALFPWNKAGLIVVSRRDGEDSMIRVCYDEKAEEYGLMHEEGSTGVLDVYAPYFDEDLGVDFSELLPEKAKQGTALLLLGNDLNQDTILGDPHRHEAGPIGMANYMDSRFFVPEGRVLVWEMPTDKAQWPTEKPKSLTSTAGSKIRTRTMKGLVHFVEQAKVKGGKTLSGKVDLGTATATWYLREGAMYTGGGYSPKPGAAVRVDNEVFYLTEGPGSYSRMRAFGITEKAVRDRLWIMVDPPAFNEDTYRKDHSHYGVYMKADRATLNWGGALLMDEMPWTDWADAFARQMPDEIAAALAAARPEPDSDDVNKRLYERLKDRIAARLNRTKRFLRDPNGVEQAKLSQPGRGRRKVEPTNKTKTTTTTTKPTAVPPVTLNQGTGPGTESASETRPVRHGLPEFRWVDPTEFEDRDWILVRYDRNAQNADGSKGSIYGNKNHATVREAVAHWQDKMVLQDEKTLTGVEAVVMEEFAELAIATVANVEALRSKITPQDLETKYRSDEALTTALMGMVGIDAMVGPRLSHVGKTVKVAKPKAA